MENRNRDFLLSFIFLTVIVGTIIIVTKKQAPIYDNLPEPYQGDTLQLIPVANPGKIELKANPRTKHYVNTKEWEITYNSDGLPTKIVKHVNAEVS